MSADIVLQSEQIMAAAPVADHMYANSDSMLAVDFLAPIHHLATIMEAHPTATLWTATAAVAALGGLWEYRAQRRITRNEKALSDVYDDTIIENTPGRLKRLFNAAGSVACVGAAAFTYMNVPLWQQPQEKQSVPPAVEVVVEKSGATLLDGQAAATSIDTVLGLFLDNKKRFELTAFVAGVTPNGTTDVTKANIEDAQKQVPLGNAPVDKAFSLAVDDIISRRSALNPGEAVGESAIVVVTNGNTVAGPKSDAEIIATKSPVIIFDVNPKSANADALKAIATETGGQYLAATDFDTKEKLDAKFKAINVELTSTTKKSADNTNWPRRLITLGFSGATAALWMSKRKLSTVFGTNAKKKEMK